MTRASREEPASGPTLRAEDRSRAQRGFKGAEWLSHDPSSLIGRTRRCAEPSRSAFRPLARDATGSRYRSGDRRDSTRHPACDASPHAAAGLALRCGCGAGRVRLDRLPRPARADAGRASRRSPRQRAAAGRLRLRADRRANRQRPGARRIDPGRRLRSPRRAASDHPARAGIARRRHRRAAPRHLSRRLAEAKLTVVTPEIAEFSRFEITRS